MNLRYDPLRQVSLLSNKINKLDEDVVLYMHEMIGWSSIGDIVEVRGWLELRVQYVADIANHVNMSQQARNWTGYP